MSSRLARPDSTLTRALRFVPARYVVSQGEVCQARGARAVLDEFSEAAVAVAGVVSGEDVERVFVERVAADAVVEGGVCGRVGAGVRDAGV